MIDHFDLTMVKRVLGYSVLVVLVTGGCVSRTVSQRDLKPPKIDTKAIQKADKKTAAANSAKAIQKANQKAAKQNKAAQKAYADSIAKALRKATAGAKKN